MCGLVGAHAPSKGVDKFAVRVHEVEEDGVVHEVVAAWVGARRGAKVDAIGLAGRLDGLVRAREADEPGVEFGDIDGRGEERVACRITSDKDGVDDGAMLGVDVFDNVCHLVELLWADVRA